MNRLGIKDFALVELRRVFLRRAFSAFSPGLNLKQAYVESLRVGTLIGPGNLVALGCHFREVSLQIRANNIPLASYNVASNCFSNSSHRRKSEPSVRFFN